MVALAAQRITDRLAAGDIGNSAEKGEALESVVAETFCQMDGVGVLFKNVVDAAGSSEIDILLWNQRHPQGLPFLPEQILIECKNWQSPVNTATVRVFTSKLNEYGLDFGILVAANGITGDPEERTAAHAHLRSQFFQRKLKVIIITRVELEALRETDDLGMLLRHKFGACIMGVGIA
uniref:restriction endonuclease n=1 Tax=Cupriavidus taiwanensis TaxID=164546 RepID=UPI000E208687|nr:restriction endonuclease [Cupriavidus taiwanensis]